jgi:hypothetical protein
MNPAAVVKMIETLGVPLAVSIALKDLKTDIADKQDELHQLVRTQNTILIKLIDRVRTLEINQMTAYTALLTVADADMPEWRRTRAERIAEHKDKDVSHNGEGE